jgi:hypothetical protein
MGNFTTVCTSITRRKQFKKATEEPERVSNGVFGALDQAVD